MAIFKFKIIISVLMTRDLESKNMKMCQKFGFNLSLRKDEIRIKIWSKIL